MNRGWVVLMVWALFLALCWVVQWAIFDPDLVAFVMLGAASLATVLLGLWALLAGGRRETPGGGVVEATPDASHATVLLGVSVLLVVLAPELGAWLAYTAAGTTALAVGGLIREGLCERRAVRAAREGRTRRV